MELPTDVPFSGRACPQLLLAIALCACLMRCGPVQAQQRLFEQEAYDRITLDKNNGGEGVKGGLLNPPGRRVPENPPPRGVLQIRLIDEPESDYEVQWGMIDK